MPNASPEALEERTTNDRLKDNDHFARLRRAIERQTDERARRWLQAILFCEERDRAAQAAAAGAATP